MDDMAADNKSQLHDEEIKDENDEEGVALTNPCRCTYAVTSAHKTYQAIFICRTCCDGKELLCVCEACANHCHEFHDELDYLGMGLAYCDCARLGLGKFCRLLEASTTEVENWNCPVGAVPDALSSRPEAFTNTTATGRPYIMDAYWIPELKTNSSLWCHSLLEQASELVTNSKETFWLDNQSSPEDQRLWCSLEKMAWRIYEHHKKLYGLEVQETGGAEWWVQAKKTHINQTDDSSINSNCGDLSGSEAVDLHYDKDESLAEKFGLGSFPTLATVTYLTDNSNPTVVFSRTYEQDDDEVISDMLVSHPVTGKHLVFDGRLLHGAPAHSDLRNNHCPSTAASTSGSNAASRETPNVRVTLLVNIWTSGKPAGVNSLSQTTRDKITKKFSKEGKKQLDYSTISDFLKQDIEEAVLEDEEKTSNVTIDRIELPFVCKGITWESEDDESGGLVVVTFPPPKHESDTIYVRFGPGMQAYLDQSCLVHELEGPKTLMGPSEPFYEDAYI